MSTETEILSYYKTLPSRMGEIRKVAGRPLTLTEKILLSHCTENRTFLRGIDYACFTPDRVAMQDATAQMAMLQFMLAGRKSSMVPASIHCDHLITASAGAKTDLEKARKENREVYEFLRSAAGKFDIDFWEPGEGIIHQVVLENYAWPGGMMTGTDSHTPTAGGLGMIAIGVGGADAVDVMSGISWELRFPRIIGIKLTGRLSGWSSAKDVILKITGMLSVKGGTGAVIEYFGPGAASISATGRATICNMGAETGATASVFGFDRKTYDYLVATGRKEVADAAMSVKEHLTGDPEAYADPAKHFDNYLEINLSEVEPYINGPFTPDAATPITRMKAEIEKNGWPDKVSAGLIGSCTNSSFEDLTRSASVIKSALDSGIKSNARINVSPGSEAVRDIAEKSGILELFRKAGAEIFASACGPCIGQWDRAGAEKEEKNTVIHSFNRNFSRRTDGNPNTHAFVASPEIVTAVTLAGSLSFNPLTDTIVNAEGKKVNLPEPRGTELPSLKYITRNGKTAPVPKKKNGNIVVNPDSERIQLLKPFEEWDGCEFTGLPLLLKARGKCTTDHISMAGKWLRYRGHLENISRNYMIGAINYFSGEAGKTTNRLNGRIESVPDVAASYRKKFKGSVVIGEENFGEGSSREHAAMEPRFFRVKAIIVKSFARIHETNLKKQGILTLTFADKADYDKIREDDIIDITGLREFTPGKPLTVTLHHMDGSEAKIIANHSYNQSQIEWFREGSALNMIRKRAARTK